MQDLKQYAGKQAIFCEKNDAICKNLYSEYGVKKGLRDERGQGVLTGLTNISQIKSFEYSNGEKIPCEGENIAITLNTLKNVRELLETDK